MWAAWVDVGDSSHFFSFVKGRLAGELFVALKKLWKVLANLKCPPVVSGRAATHPHVCCGSGARGVSVLSLGSFFLRVLASLVVSVCSAVQASCCQFCLFPFSKIVLIPSWGPLSGLHKAALWPQPLASTWPPPPSPHLYL